MTAITFDTLKYAKRLKDKLEDRYMYNQRAVMADIYENRRLRLRQLIEERFEGRRRNLGERAATRIEQALGLPNGWLDEPPDGVASNMPYRGHMGPPRKVQLHAIKGLLAAGYSQKEAARQLGVP